ncbi:MAG: hypothetical protein GX175_03330 [Halanaerobiaceae bacterium]|nr:hypothetical protein [Halanaerobiaceae bacterium]
MTLFQYIIRILMGNSDTVFAALVMGVFGYIGWLLWKLNERFNRFLKEWYKHEEGLADLRGKLNRIDEGVYKELIKRLEDNLKEMDKLLLAVNDNNEEIERMHHNIITEMKESTNEIKDIIMILLNNRARSVRKEKKEQALSEKEDKNE